MKREYMRKYGDFFCDFWQVAEISKPARDSLGRWGFTIEVNEDETETGQRVQWYLSILEMKYEIVNFSGYDFYWAVFEAEATK